MSLVITYYVNMFMKICFLLPLDQHDSVTTVSKFIQSIFKLVYYGSFSFILWFFTCETLPLIL